MPAPPTSNACRKLDSDVFIFAPHLENYFQVFPSGEQPKGRLCFPEKGVKLFVELSLSTTPESVVEYSWRNSLIGLKFTPGTRYSFHQIMASIKGLIFSAEVDVFSL